MIFHRFRHVDSRSGQVRLPVFPIPHRINPGTPPLQFAKWLARFLLFQRMSRPIGLFLCRGEGGRFWRFPLIVWVFLRHIDSRMAKISKRLDCTIVYHPSISAIAEFLRIAMPRKMLANIESEQSEQRYELAAHPCLYYGHSRSRIATAQRVSR